MIPGHLSTQNEEEVGCDSSFRADFGEGLPALTASLNLSATSRTAAPALTVRAAQAQGYVCIKAIYWYISKR